MAQLSTIISSVLHDMVLAQHEANLYAITLSEAYSKNGRMENFPLPAIALGEMELNIRYGIKEEDTASEQYEINYSALRKESNAICQRLAEVMIGSIVNTVEALGLDDDPHTSNLIEQIDQQPNVKRDFCTFLSRRIFISLQKDFTRLVNNNGTINEQVLLNTAVQTADEEFLNHPDLTTLFGTPEGEKARFSAKEEMKSTLDLILPKIIKDVNLKRKRLMPSIEVIVSSEELARLPEEAIHTFHFKITPTPLNISIINDPTTL